MEVAIESFLLLKRGYLKKADEVILDRLGFSQPHPKEILELCSKIKRKITEDLTKEYLNFNKDNILVIGDLHEPFCLEKYLDHCKKIQVKYKCGTTIFIGDLIDNHYSSYHETDPDGLSAGKELDKAINRLQRWYNAFPEAYVMIGNHDRIINRKATTSGLSKRWIRNLNEVLEVKNWEFLEEIDINNVNYNHGEGGTAKSRMKNEMQSLVQGHLHAQFYIEYIVSPTSRIFGMQVGCGVDRKSYAMSYGKNFKKPIIGCGVVSGKEAIPSLHPMNLH